MLRKIELLTNFILLNNGTLLGFYDWNVRYLSKEERGADSWDNFETDKTGPDEKFVIDGSACISCGTCAGVCPVDAPEEE